MSNVYKTLSITLAIVLGVSFLSRQVKAIATGTVAAGAAAAAVATVVGVLLADVVDELCKSIDRAVSHYEMETHVNSVMSENERKELYYQTVAEMNAYLESKKQSDFASSYNELYHSYSSSQRVTNFVQAQQYFNSLSNPTAAQKVLYFALKSIENNASGLTLASDYSLSMKSNVFSDLYGGALQDSLVDICGVEVNISKESGMSGRDVLMSNPAATTYFPTLAAMYEATHVYELSFGSNKNAYLKFSTSYLGTEHYYVLIHNGTLTYNDVIYARFVRQNASNVNVPAADHVSLQFWNNTKNHYNLHAFIQNADTDVTAYTGDRIYFGVGDSFTSSLDIKTNLAFDFLGSYVFEFDRLEKAQAFVIDIAADSEALAFYDPATDFDSVIGGIEVGLTNLEKAVAARQAELGTDEDLDIVINPGMEIGEDGSITYSPSISIANSTVSDNTDSKAGEAENEKEAENEGSKEGGYFLGIPLNTSFPLYEQCKQLLDNLFNYNDVVEAPSFRFYWDSNGDGINETYNALDLSFLDTYLTNKNMEEKGWWSVSIKVIDVIRYIIAAVVYGLFVMRLIKRLPYFYGGGPWAYL